MIRSLTLSLNQLTIMKVEKIPEQKEPEVLEIPKIPEEQFKLEKGYYLCVCFILCFKKKVSVDSKEEQADVKDDTDEEQMGDVNLDDEREPHWRMVFDNNGGEVDDKKALVHDKRWYICVNEN